jgi:hypothetical protein
MRYKVVPAGAEALEVEGDNWIIALGVALEQVGAATRMSRLACETLPNGTVIAKDLRGSGRFVVQPLAESSDDPPSDDGEALRTLDPEVDMVEADSIASWLQDIDEAASPIFAAQAALAAAQMAVPCDSASVLQLDSRGLRFVAASGPIATQLVGRYIPSDAGAAGFAVQHRQVMVLYDVADDARHYEAIDEETGYTTRNLCCMPVVHNDHVYGVIEVINIPSGEPFSTEAVGALERIAGRLGRRFHTGRPVRSTLSAASPAPETDDLVDTTVEPEEDTGDPITLEDGAMEPISVEDIALALPAEDEEPTWTDER